MILSRTPIRIVSLFFAFLTLITPQLTWAKAGLDYYDYIDMKITPIPCKAPEAGTAGDGAYKCPTGFAEPSFYSTGKGISDKPNPYGIAPVPYNTHKSNINAGSTNQPDRGAEVCAKSFEEFQQSPQHRHYWAEDPEITALGKANERARQFLFWVMDRSPQDDNPKLKEIWAISRNVAISFLILTAALMGIWLMLAHRLRYRIVGEFGLWESVSKIILSLLFISLSASIILLLVQLSEILMKFFINSIGGSDMFNVYFGSHSSATGSNYIGFVGCRDLNIRVGESIEAEVFLLRLTNMTYYIMGCMIILRKILLWFLMFVSPFLPILLSFPLIRNTGKIWIGVFFQWLFYGPLMALFLGATGAIWKYGIPYPFDFSRINSYLGYVYPNAIMIVYGGPAQINKGAINAFNSGNYVDTFVEYVISLVMLWAVIFFPWWLLRIFRDYCCEAIMAMGASLKQLSDTLRPTPPPKAPPPVQPIRTQASPAIDENKLGTTISRAMERGFSLANANMVRQAQTTQIVTAMNLKATSLKEVAKLESNKALVSSARQNFALLQNPLAANTTSEREKYLNVRTELFTRANSKNDTIARSLLSTVSTSSAEHIQRKEELIKSVDTIVSRMNTIAPASLSQISSQTTKLTTEKVGQITNNVIQKIAGDMRAVSQISTKVSIPVEQVKSILQSYAANITLPVNQIVQTIAAAAGATSDAVHGVLHETNSIVQRGFAFQQTLHDTGIAPEKAQELLTQIQVANTAPTTVTTEVNTSPPSTPTQTNRLTEIFKDQTVSTFVRNILKTVSSDETVLTQIQTHTGLSRKQIESTLTTLADSPDITNPTVFTKLQADHGVDHVKALDIVKDAIAQSSQASDAVPATIENTDASEQAELMQEQLQTAIDPGQHIEEVISIPEDQSIDEYEEIRSLWVDQYEDGEVPLSAEITDRLSWVQQDTVMMTNILNKLISTDQKLRQQALDEVGFILPIFLINNLNGAQLLTYLKAKLSAAKQVQRSLLKKKKVEAAAQVTATSEEELVEINRVAPEQNTKHLEVDETGQTREANE